MIPSAVVTNGPAAATVLVVSAAADLAAAGVTDVYVLDGGIAALANAGLPLKRGPRP